MFHTDEVIIVVVVVIVDVVGFGPGNHFPLFHSPVAHSREQKGTLARSGQGPDAPTMDRRDGCGFRMDRESTGGPGLRWMRSEQFGESVAHHVSRAESQVKQVGCRFDVGAGDERQRREWFVVVVLVVEDVELPEDGSIAGVPYGDGPVVGDGQEVVLLYGLKGDNGSSDGCVLLLLLVMMIGILDGLRFGVWFFWQGPFPNVVGSLDGRKESGSVFLKEHGGYGTAMG